MSKDSWAVAVDVQEASSSLQVGFFFFLKGGPTGPESYIKLSYSSFVSRLADDAT